MRKILLAVGIGEMKRLLLSSTVLLTVMVSASDSFSADFQNGMDAARRGDLATALIEWTPLAEQGHVDSQYNLGFMYEKGDGVPQDIKTAIKWYTRAAKQGHPGAPFNLGFMKLVGMRWSPRIGQL